MDATYDPTQQPFPPGTKPSDVATALQNLGHAFGQIPIVQTAIRGFTAPHDVMYANGPVTTEDLIGPAQDMLSLLSGGAGNAERGAAGIFGGRLARGADLHALDQAMEMAGGPSGSLGADPYHIWRRTGWFKGVDGQWRFEIPDNEATIGEKIPNNVFHNQMKHINAPMPLRDVINHPRLYEHYPLLGDVPVSNTGFNFGIYGAYRHNPPHFYFRGAKPGDMLDTAIHEIQHAVQDTEGFAPGGNVRQMYPEGYEPIKEELQRRAKTAAGFINSMPRPLMPEGSPITKIHPDWFGDAVNAVSRYLNTKELTPEQNSMLKAIYHSGRYNDFENFVKAGQISGKIENAARYNYDTLAGEAEARNAALRRTLKPVDRYNYQPPWETYDVPVEQQWMFYDPNTQAMLKALRGGNK